MIPHYYKGLLIATALLLGLTYYLGLVHGYDRGSADGGLLFSKYDRATRGIATISAAPGGEAVATANAALGIQAIEEGNKAGFVGYLLDWRRKPILELGEQFDQMYRSSGAAERK